ncbi:Ank1 [Symbiodinium sp. CCMP2456]|nr:Ank1 [Symbiodinium sp. CCMP2456]
MAADEETLRSQREEELQPLRTKTHLLAKLYGDEGADRDEILEEVYTPEEVAGMKQEDKESVPKRWLSEHGALAKTVSQNLRASAGLPEPHKAINDLKQSETEVEEQAARIAQNATESRDALFALQTYEENLVDKKRQIEDLRGAASAKVKETGELLEAKWRECQELLAQYRFDHLRNELLYVRERIAEDAHTKTQEELNTAREAWQITKEQAERCESEACGQKGLRAHFGTEGGSGQMLKDAGAGNLEDDESLDFPTDRDLQLVMLGFVGTSEEQVDDMEAALQHELETVRCLLKAGASLEKAGLLGTPLCLTALAGDSEVLRFLLESRANIEAQTNAGATPLLLVTEGLRPKASLDVASILVEAGAVVDSRDKLGRTPLWIASRRGHMKVVCLLLKAGARPSMRDIFGKTPFDAARGRKHVRRLLSNAKWSRAPHVKASRRPLEMVLPKCGAFCSDALGVLVVLVAIVVVAGLEVIVGPILFWGVPYCYNCCIGGPKTLFLIIKATTLLHSAGVKRARSHLSIRMRSRICSIFQVGFWALDMTVRDPVKCRLCTLRAMAPGRTAFGFHNSCPWFMLILYPNPPGTYYIGP